MVCSTAGVQFWSYLFPLPFLLLIFQCPTQISPLLWCLSAWAPLDVIFPYLDNVTFCVTPVLYTIFNTLFFFQLGKLSSPGYKHPIPESEPSSLEFLMLGSRLLSISFPMLCWRKPEMEIKRFGLDLPNLFPWNCLLLNPLNHSFCLSKCYQNWPGKCCHNLHLLN